MIPTRVVHLLSGGLDSVVLLHDLIRQKCMVHCLGIDYGQKHIREITLARTLAAELNVGMHVIRIPQLLGSALTDGTDTVVVPYRNPTFLFLAANYACAASAQSITIGCNKSDAEMFPDCRPEFIEAMNRAVKAAHPEWPIEICAPYIDKTKREIAELGKTLGVDLNRTWSCYTPRGQEACGECPACFQRKTALCD